MEKKDVGFPMAEKKKERKQGRSLILAVSVTEISNSIIYNYMCKSFKAWT